jgi:hypothetical protein
MSRQDNCELRRYNTLSISNSNFANALQAERICCECLPCPEIVQWLCPISNEACVTPCAAAYSQFIRSYSHLFRTSTPGARAGSIRRKKIKLRRQRRLKIIAAMPITSLRDGTVICNVCRIRRYKAERENRIGACRDNHALRQSEGRARRQRG